VSHGSAWAELALVVHDIDRPPVLHRVAPAISSAPRIRAGPRARFHSTRPRFDERSQKDGGLPPDSVVQDDDEILADSERLVALHHDPSWGAMVRVALALLPSR